MFEHLPLAAVTFGLVLVIAGFARVRMAQQLEAKLGALRLLLGFYAVALVLIFVAFLVHGAAAPRLSPIGEVELATLREHLVAQQSHARDASALLAGVVLQLAILLPAVAHVLRELGSFVLVQRTDLLARDQAVVATARS